MDVKDNLNDYNFTIQYLCNKNQNGFIYSIEAMCDQYH